MRAAYFGDHRTAWEFGDINPTRPAVHQIAARIRESIRAGDWRPADELPRSGQIARRYGVSVSTAASALRRVAYEGLIRYVVGRGYFVRGAS